MARINDELLNAYLQMVGNENATLSEGNCWVLNSFFIPKVTHFPFVSIEMFTKITIHVNTSTKSSTKPNTNTSCTTTTTNTNTNK